MHKLIYSETELQKFHSLLTRKPLEPSEAFFLSMSARNKYLTPEEREVYDLGRTEMFARKLVKSDKFSDFLRVIRSMEVNEGGYTSRGGKVLPSKCMVVYANINPSSGKKALKEFYSKTQEFLFDGNQDFQYGRLDSVMMGCYQRNRGQRNFLDIDFDIPEEGESHVRDFCAGLQTVDVKYHVIKTRSGYHVLLEKDTVHFNYPGMVEIFDTRVQMEFGKEHVEVVVNKNEMVPVPGTIQSDFEVRFVDF